MIRTHLKKCEEVIKWLDENQSAEKDEFEYQQKELENFCRPIMTNLYQNSSSQAKNEANGPKVEEVD